MSIGTIKKVAGPLVIAEGMRDANMFDVVRVSNQRLIGEIIEIHGCLLYTSPERRLFSFFRINIDHIV